MRIKSVAYSKAAQRLIDGGNNLHCTIAFTYYSLFMFMKHLLANMKKNAMTYSELEFSGVNPHEKVLENLYRFLPANKETSSIIKRISELHELRVEAEYSTVEYQLEFAIAIHEECEVLKKKLKLWQASV